MTRRKYKSYSLWMHYIVRGWTKIVTCKEEGNYPGISAKDILQLAINDYVGGEADTSLWKILPEGRQPAGLRKSLERADKARLRKRGGK